jgi:hypothetical protein
MSAPHTPFPIADFANGFYTGKEPWLSPSNAFRELRNGRIYRGRLEKRRGYSRLSELGVAASTINGTGSGANSNATYSIAHSVSADGYFLNLIPETAVFEWEDASAAVLTAKLDLSQYPLDLSDTTAPLIDVVDAATGTTVIGFYLIVGGGFIVNWVDHPDYTGAGPNRGTLDYYAPGGEPCTGITSFKDADGTESLLAFDENAIYVFDDTSGAFLEDATGVTLTATDADYVWTWPFDDYLMFTNNVDPVYKFTPGGSPTIEEIDTEFDSGSGGNDLDTCLMVVRFKGRAVFLNTKENGTRYPRRARWSGGGTFEVHETNGLDFADAPSHLGSIVTSHFIADRLFVGFELGWMELVDTNDAAAPLKWEVSTARYGAVAKMGTIQDSYRILSRSEFGIHAIDPNGQYAIDAVIPDYVMNLDASKRNLCWGTRNDAEHAFFWTFARAEDTAPSRVLAAQFDDKENLSWSVHTLAFNCFGSFSNSFPRTWDSFSPLTWDDLTFSWDSVRGTSGFRRLIGGAADGTVYILDNSDSDNGDDIELYAVSQGLAPYPGQRSHLGWIDIYARAVDGATLTVGWTPDDRLSVLKSVSFDLTPDAVSSQVYRRMLVNRKADFHKLTLTITGSAFAAIDAVIPWFAPAGRVRRFG